MRGFLIDQAFMKALITCILSISFFPLIAQKLDTVKVYNVNCTIKLGNSVIGWAGNWTEFYPAVECPEPKDKYYENFKLVNKYLDQKKFFWIKLYDTDETLLYEGLKYSDCMLGPFICYYPNGSIRMKGEYSGARKTSRGGYVMKKCSGKPIGTWEYYDESGTLVKTEKK
jgi:hypothetical protein